MPELPEVEVVRAGLALAVDGARVLAVSVIDARALKRHVPFGVGRDGEGGHGRTLSFEAGALRAADFERRLTGRVLAAPIRRGKFMWIPVANAGEGTVAGSEALLAHLGMSGQLLLRATDAVDDRHVRIRIWIEHATHGELRLDFADQRIFGSLAIDGLVATAPHGTIPAQAAHIARDPLDPLFDDAEFIKRVGARSIGVKKLLLDQTLVSGVGNIYADEALWLSRIHPDTAGLTLSVRKRAELLLHVRDVFEKALAEGGTSFDAQYVNVNGESGYFAHSLNAYGRGGEPCPRCGTFLRRVPFGGRSSHFCPRCQRKR